MAGRKAGSADIAPMVRGAFKRALLLIENGEQKDLSRLLAEAIKEQGILRVMDVISKYNPKDLNVATTEMSPEKWLEHMSNASKPESAEAENSVPGPVH